MALVRITPRIWEEMKWERPTTEPLTPDEEIAPTKRQPLDRGSQYFSFLKRVT